MSKANAIRTIRTLLPGTGAVSTAQIISAVDIALSIPLYSSLDKDSLIRETEALYNITIDDFRIIEKQERRLPWLPDKKAGIKWNFWNRYRDYLEIDKNFAPEVLGKLDRLTDRILDSIFDPTKNIVIDKRGLVVGQVQSGKTSNYTGLICKAADSGYKLIIVLAGIHNNLRSQTQLRLDEGFLGFDTQHQRAFNQNNLWIGVGKTDQGSIAHSLTSSFDKGDFNAPVANALGLNFNTNEPIIAVVKKNVHVLNRLNQWLSAQAVDMPDGRRVIRNKSLLLIDDEADNASINTNKDEDPSTKINGLIRNTLRLFDKSAYIGYTATPFANIFIPLTEDDLFPRDFIINIPAPSNYIGPEKIFGFSPLEDDGISDEVLPIVNRIDDYQSFVPNGHKKGDDKPSDAPESLKLSIRCFIITCAIRRLRGQTAVHNSMLIHISRFTDWQAVIKNLAENIFDYYRRGIELNIPSIINELKDTFETDNIYYKSYLTVSSQILKTPSGKLDLLVEIHKWEDVLKELNEASARIQVREINGGSADALNYFDHPNGLSVIAIGGDKLARGLTLEGLSISYYLRASKMYDTLMQMGRWFGYRPGYVDLCRLFTSRELNEWFCHITLASEELRDEFDYMADVAGSTPEQYSLRVRNHPGVLQISASNKIRRAVNVDISWAGRLVESYEMSKRKETILSNFNATKEFIRSLPSYFEEKRNAYLWKDVDAQLIRPLLQKIRVSENLKAADPANLLRFIDAQLINKEYNLWRVALMNKKNSDVRENIPYQDTQLDIGCFLRNQDDKNSNTTTYYLRKSHIISPNDEFIDLSEDEYKTAKARTTSFWKTKDKKGEPSYPNGEIVRNEFRNPQMPLLIIYLLNPEGAKLSKGENPIMGYAISFPSSKKNTTVSYSVHEQLMATFNLEEPSEDYEINNDDED
ncbi:MAG: Z1 domain-containing protein [Opitutaceae bacterium]|nr:Z1 domain-containing protein [Cytophagales bacterium]